MSEKKFTPAQAAMMVLAKAHELYKLSNLAKAETGHEKGIHTKSKDFAQGSDAGNKLAVWPKKDAAKSPAMGKLVTEAHDSAKESHKQVLAEMKAMPKPKLGKSEENDENPDSQADAKLGEEVEKDVHEHEEKNEDPGHEDGMKGHIKLAKFMGRMEHKKGLKAKELAKDDMSGDTGAPEMDKAEKVSKDYSGGQKKGPQGYPKYQEQAQNEKGVHTPVSGVTAFPGGKGTSEAGGHAKERYNGKPLPGLVDHSKDLHAKKLAEMKAMPKPKLPG